MDFRKCFLGCTQRKIFQRCCHKRSCQHPKEVVPALVTERETRRTSPQCGTRTRSSKAVAFSGKGKHITRCTKAYQACNRYGTNREFRWISQSWQYLLYQCSFTMPFPLYTLSWRFGTTTCSCKFNWRPLEESLECIQARRSHEG